MGTRSIIGVRNSDSTIRAIYCHYDGYPSHNGAMLSWYYSDPMDAIKLVEGGDLRGLAHSFERNVLLADAQPGNPYTFDSIEEFLEFTKTSTDAEYVYLYITDTWFVLSSCHDVSNDEVA